MGRSFRPIRAGRASYCLTSNNGRYVLTNTWWSLSQFFFHTKRDPYFAFWHTPLGMWKPPHVYSPRANDRQLLAQPTRFAEYM